MKTRFILMILLFGTIMSFTNCSKDDDVKNTAPTASNLASPANEATNVTRDLILTWEQSTDVEEDEITYDVYLGESENLSENELVASDMSELSYIPTGIEFSKNYYWKVIAKDTKGASSSSSVFSFTTISSTDFEMVSVQGGTFQMGSNDCDSNEKPIHSVTLSSFEIGKYEVTQAQWVKVMGSNPSDFIGDNLPVNQVSWNNIQTFIRVLNEQTGLTYRLPTEAEWEFAARGGNSSNGYIYAGSNTIGDVAEYEGNNDTSAKPVGGKQANELGIYDMSGNVIEWCNDWYDSYGSDAVSNPTGPASGSDRVLRGGAYSFSAPKCRVDSRDGIAPNFEFAMFGFRLARSL